MSTATFHAGELAMQQQTGALDWMAQAGPRMIRDQMPPQHREFFAQLPFLIAGSVDADGQPWASVLAGPPGFIGSPDPRQLQVRARPLPHDPLAGALAAGAPIGLLGIEPQTRRRNRLNGHVSGSDAGGFSVHVDQSFGNCPKYIRSRTPEFTGAVPATAVAHRAEALDARAQAIISAADTFFIATAHPLARQSSAPSHGVDVSHRGGKPGFVRVDGAARLVVPDFRGNFVFNTLGNLALESRCALLFIDDGTGDLLSVAATGEVVTEGAELAAFEGAQRLLRLDVTAVLRVEAVLPLRWSEGEPSPALAGLGHW
jgi:predicted pyridoxine 5'-phosphate oxidase superfamily flavin-nucleotide-binding protein